MAVKDARGTGGRHLAVGLNVGFMILLAVILAAGLQWIGYTYSARADWTTTGVNSLSPATVKVLSSLQSPIRITSLYFTTDLEDEDQVRYRKAVSDLIDLYRVTNRTQFVTEAVNPLQDHDKLKELFKGLAGLKKFKEQAVGYEDAVNHFRDELLGRIGQLLTDELAQLQGMVTMGEIDARLVADIKGSFENTQQDIQTAARDISDALASDVPSYGGAVNSLRLVYGNLNTLLESISKLAGQLPSVAGKVSPAVESFVANAAGRYEPLKKELKAEQDKLAGLPQLELEEMLRQITPMSNALVVQNDQEAGIVSFDSVWPPLDQGMPATAFKDRRFVGEQKLTAAVLRLTQQQKPAVMFVRFGGAPLFQGGFMPGQPPAMYSRLKEQLEDVNFTIHEWDLAADEEMPKIDPAPTRTLFVVLPPAAPANPFAQPQPPSFSPEHRAKVEKALGENPRAMFLCGYQMNAFGMTSGYEYNDYLRDRWGLSVTSDRLLLYFRLIAPEKYRLERDPVGMSDCRFAADQPIVAGLAKGRITLPWSSPLELAGSPPAGVTLEKLAWLDEAEGLWSVGNVDYYRKQLTNEFIVRSPDDKEGEFALAAVASRGAGRVVVVGSTDFATDRVALAQEMVLTAQGLSVRPRNPGNVALFINTLHWLNDNIDWMNLGTPLDTATLAVEKDSPAMTAVQVITCGVLPGLAACAGLVMWWMRRS